MHTSNLQKGTRIKQGSEKSGDRNHRRDKQVPIDILQLKDFFGVFLKIGLFKADLFLVCTQVKTWQAPSGLKSKGGEDRKTELRQWSEINENL